MAMSVVCLEWDLHLRGVTRNECYPSTHEPREAAPLRPAALADRAARCREAMEETRSLSQSFVDLR